MRFFEWVKETKISLLMATLLAFALGFVDLVRGGITVSALLLTVAYCVLLPLLIWHWSDRDGRICG